MHDGGSAVWFGFYTPQRGDPSEYAFATIPDGSDPGWGSAPNTDTIGFSRTSIVPSCDQSGAFTYFQTFVNIPANVTVNTFTIAFSGIDDGVRVTIFNTNYPSGIVVPGSYVYLFGSGTANLSTLVKSGTTNRVVVTHIDDCPIGCALNSAQVVLNGTAVFSPPNITAEPTNQIVDLTNMATFAVTATGTGLLSYQWLFNSNPLAGATNNLLVITNVQAGNAGNYQVVVANAYGSVTSSVALLTVLVPAPPPGIVMIAGGYDFSLYGSGSGNLWAVGDNYAGQLGDGTEYNIITTQIGRAHV